MQEMVGELVWFLARVFNVRLESRVTVAFVRGFCVDCDVERTVNVRGECSVCGSRSVDFNVYKEAPCVAKARVERAESAARNRREP